MSLCKNIEDMFPTYVPVSMRSRLTVGSFLRGRYGSDVLRLFKSVSKSFNASWFWFRSA